MSLNNQSYAWLSDASITSVPGFQAAAAACGLKPAGHKDLALLYSEQPAVCVGVFTQNKVRGHSLQYTAQHLAQAPKAQAVVINAGNANACVGPQGLQDAKQMAEIIAHDLKLSPDLVLIGSTGVIGIPLPMYKIIPGIHQACQDLAATPQAGHSAMYAIMTTDTRPKEAALQLTLGGKSCTLAGMAKGSGMIHPNMATMIALITTDVAIDPACLKVLLKQAVSGSFNRLSIDGDTSVCDMALVLSNGMAANSVITDPQSAAGQHFGAALACLCERLARGMAADGEGATKMIDIRIKGAATARDAYQAALAIARSPLCKTAIFGADANWGRILTAAGYSGANFDPDLADVWIGKIHCCRNGAAIDFDEVAAKAYLQKSSICLTVDFNLGQFEDHYWTCDFSYDYVKINGSYRS
ncbi:bifunctional glutamate N-acetyltransferase/amino-acid acetyltransferase ArgJ [Oscillospiraceae bacterium HV4-5-C5C]|nr:bifunctional glutamate N-acetyltransferase/amino-acid acetyltransferase ArgJ [Oscillospiraceae bacterium HV4-5-C5C]